MNKIKDSALIVIQNLAPPLVDMAVMLQQVNPVWGPIIAYGAGLLGVFRELAIDRGKELLDFINEHKNEFSSIVINTPEFKATFLNVWEMHIRENSEEKRKRLRKFLLGIGSGKPLDSDLHTKFYTLIGQMTDKEAEMFGILFSMADREKFNSMNLNLNSGKFSKYPDGFLQNICYSLHSYRLINTTEATIGSIMVIKQITPFGELFYDYILQEDIPDV